MIRSALTPLLAALVLLASCTTPLLVRPPAKPLRDKQTAEWLEAIRAVAQPGDWVVTRGYAVTSEVVAAATNRPWSHAAVLDEGLERVIEATGKGVHYTDIHEVVHEAHRIKVLRPKWATPENRPEALAIAHELVGKNYDYLGTIGFGSQEQFYCSELTVYMYHRWHAGAEDEGFGAVVAPSDLFRWGEELFDSGPRGNRTLIDEIP